MIHKFTCQQGDPQVYRFQYVNEDGSLLEAEQIESMKLFVTEAETKTETTPNGGETLTVASCVFEAREWDQDDVGYNVRIPVKGEYLAEPNKTYRCEVHVTPVDGEVFQLDHVEYDTTETYSYD